MSGLAQSSARELKADVEKCSHDIYEQFVSRHPKIENRLKLNAEEPEQKKFNSVE